MKIIYFFNKLISNRIIYTNIKLQLFIIQAASNLIAHKNGMFRVSLIKLVTKLKSQVYVEQIFFLFFLHSRLKSCVRLLFKIILSRLT